MKKKNIPFDIGVIMITHEIPKMNEEEKMEFITRMVAMWQAGRIPAHRALSVIKDTVKTLKNEKTKKKAHPAQTTKKTDPAFIPSDTRRRAHGH